MSSVSEEEWYKDPDLRWLIGKIDTAIRLILVLLTLTLNSIVLISPNPKDIVSFLINIPVLIILVIYLHSVFYLKFQGRFQVIRLLLSFIPGIFVLAVFFLYDFFFNTEGFFDVNINEVAIWNFWQARSDFYLFILLYIVLIFSLSLVTKLYVKFILSLFHTYKGVNQKFFSELVAEFPLRGKFAKEGRVISNYLFTSLAMFNAIIYLRILYPLTLTESLGVLFGFWGFVLFIVVYVFSLRKFGIVY